MMYQVELLGGLRVTQQSFSHVGVPVTQFRTRKTALILSYLALFPTRRHAREALIELFWPDLDLAAGRDNLSTCLSQLRRQFAGGETTGVSVALPPIFGANRDAVWLNQAAVETDVAGFERDLNAAAERDMPLARRRAHLEAAIACYKGPLLPDVYEEWALSQQSRLAQRHALGLAALALAQAQSGAPDLALATARLAQHADPFSESAYQTEMRLLAQRGEKEGACRVYERFAAHLSQELACRPSSALQKFVQRLDSIEPDAIEPESEVASEEHAPEPFARSPVPDKTTFRSTVPTPLVKFWGRDEEIKRLLALLSHGGSQLITITGPGGIGKTHLALVTAARFAEAAPDVPLFWVPLADISDPRLFISTIQKALGEPSAPSGDEVDALVTGLNALGRGTGVVLLLDNLEQLVGEDTILGQVPALIRVLRERVPRLTVLGTSRRILGLAGEQEVPLHPLPLPPPVNWSLMQAAEAHLADLRTVPSVALFVERARLVQPDFSLTVANAKAVTAICRRLEGLPLALEIAAAWVRTLPLPQMQERLEAHVFALQSRRRDLPPRHRSLQATVEWSWELLDTELRRFFLRLCVFRGGCTLEAAEAVGGNGDPQSLDWLTRLLEHSLLTARTDNLAAQRYQFLEPIRQWGLAKLAEDDAAFDTALRAHAHYFLALYTHRDKSVLLDEQNCLAACDTLLRPQANPEQEAVDVADSLILVCELCEFWNDRGLHPLAYQYLTAALARYRATTLGTSAEKPTRFARGLQYTGAFLRAMGQFEKAETVIREAKEQHLAAGDEVSAAACEGELGILAEHRDDFDAAAQAYTRVVETARRCNKPRLIGVGLLHLGNAEKDRGNRETARAHYDEAYALFQQVNDTASLTFLLLVRSVLLVLQNEFAPARDDILAGLDLALKINNPRLQSHLFATAAVLAARAGAPATAVTFQAFADRLIEESGIPLNESEFRARASLPYTTDSLSTDARAHAETQGRTVPLSSILHLLSHVPAA